jgi:hypothetical protein
MGAQSRFRQAAGRRSRPLWLSAFTYKDFCPSWRLFSAAAGPERSVPFMQHSAKNGGKSLCEGRFFIAWGMLLVNVSVRWRGASLIAASGVLLG